jgi:hypothetical protein
MNEPFDDSADEIIPVEWPTFYTPVPVWVLLCGCTAQAYRMYAFLAEHINNRTPRQRIAFPSQKAIARAMNLKDYRDVAKYRDELASLGAIRFEPFRYAGGMRRRYRYWVRFNPPEGYAGLLSLADFYEANPDVKAKRTASVRDVAMGETAGQDGGGENPTSESGGNPTSQGGESPTAQQPDQQEPDPQEPDAAPSARSAPGCRQAPSGSKASSKSGSAASGKSSAPRLTKQQRQQVQAVRALLPPDLNQALGERLPRNVSDAILAGLAPGAPRERTVEQLVTFRVLSRWNGYWAARFYAGELTRDGRPPYGPLLSMLKDTVECGNLGCEDRVDIHTGEACKACAVRTEDKRADRRPVPEEPGVSEPAATVPRQAVAPMQCCDRCDRGFRSHAPGLCGDCQLEPVNT